MTNEDVDYLHKEVGSRLRKKLESAFEKSEESEYYSGMFAALNELEHLYYIATGKSLLYPRRKDDELLD